MKYNKSNDIHFTLIPLGNHLGFRQNLKKYGSNFLTDKI
jgi:hypothetical protein